MSKTTNKKTHNRIVPFISFVFIILIVVLITNASTLLGRKGEITVVSNGSLFYEEPAEGYVIRNEVVLQGENYKNGMVQIVADGERAAKGQKVFRYYSNSEEKIKSQMVDLDTQINEIMDNSGLTIVSSDITSLEKQIETTIDGMQNLNDLQKIQENKNKIEAYIYKKAQMTASLSPSNSYLKELTDKRNALESELENGSENICAPSSGLLSYRVDGLEDVLKTDNFDYLTSELLKGFNLKVGAAIPQSTESGKIVDNFESYIVTSTNTERAMTAKVGDKVTIKLSNTTTIDAKIDYIKDEDKSRILVFKIEDKIDELLEYRKISFDIVWWSYSGWKISNSAILEIDDKTYVERNDDGFREKILIKVLRQNDTYSIVENYTDEELVDRGYSQEEIDDMGKLKLYDEILLH